MTRSLLDINVLIALFDELHQAHHAARHWMEENIQYGWASCPITENGFVRIMAQPRYVRPITISDALDRLGDATATPYHEFWADNVSLLDAEKIDRTRIHGSRQLTDIYLLALAVHHQGRFVTFDASIPRSAVPASRAEHLVVL